MSRNIPVIVDLSSGCDGSTKEFSLPYGYLAGTVRVQVNGLQLIPGTDFTETSVGFELSALEDAPESGEHLLTIYYARTPTRISPPGGVPGQTRSITLPGGGSIPIHD